RRYFVLLPPFFEGKPLGIRIDGDDLTLDLLSFHRLAFEFLRGEFLVELDRVILPDSELGSGCLGESERLGMGQLRVKAGAVRVDDLELPRLIHVGTRLHPCRRYADCGAVRAVRARPKMYRRRACVR